MRVEHEDQRGGAWPYVAAWDVRRGVVMGRCAPSTGIEPCGRGDAHVMKREPARLARRVCWVVDTGSSHRGDAAARRLAPPKVMVGHPPGPASGLHPVELACSLMQRTGLTPNACASLEDVAPRWRRYEALSTQPPRPFAWQFTRAKRAECLTRLEARGARVDQGPVVPERPHTNQGKPVAAYPYKHFCNGALRVHNDRIEYRRDLRRWALASTIAIGCLTSYL
jgi:hypothetical protein